jgi:aerobic carbon-monoxide dehydrogenase medium subunit
MLPGAVPYRGRLSTGGIMKFEYVRPSTLAEAIGLLSEYRREAQVIAGGTDVMRKTRARVLDPKYLIDITGIPGLGSISDGGSNGLRIGGASTVRGVETSPLVRQRFPVLVAAAGLLGSVAIRNVATVGGNLCNASPAAECAPALLCLSGEARIVGPNGERVVPLDEFFVGPGATVVGEDELVAEIHIPGGRPGTRGSYLKHSPRGSIDLAIVGVAAVATFAAGAEVCEEIKLALGAVAPTPVRARTAEDLIRGKVLDEGLIAAAAEAAAADSHPISDVRASADYRRDMVRVFTRRALRALAAAGPKKGIS